MWRSCLSIESFLVVEAMDVTSTNESVYRNATVGVVTCEEVREVEHTIKTSSTIVPLVVLGSVVVVPAVLTLPAANVTAEVEDRSKLITEVKTSSRGDYVTELLVCTMRITYTALRPSVQWGWNFSLGAS